jgi:hypothetical protein
MRLGRGGGDTPSDGNTPERGGGDLPSDINTLELERRGGDPPLDGSTLVERTPGNQHNDLGEVITPCRDKLMLVWMTYLSIGNLQRQLSFSVLIIRTEKEMMYLMD